MKVLLNLFLILSLYVNASSRDAIIIESVIKSDYKNRREHLVQLASIYRVSFIFDSLQNNFVTSKYEIITLKRISSITNVGKLKIKRKTRKYYNHITLKSLDQCMDSVNRASTYGNSVSDILYTSHYEEKIRFTLITKNDTISWYKVAPFTEDNLWRNFKLDKCTNTNTLDVLILDLLPINFQSRDNLYIKSTTPRR